MSFKNKILIDVDTSREATVLISKDFTYAQGTTKEEMQKYIINDMATLCEGLVTLIHAAEQNGLKPSHESLADCIKHLQDGFTDANYIGKIVQ